MKKVFKFFVAIIMAIAIIGSIMFLIDCSNIKSGKTPLFAQVTKTLNDGGTIEYTGLGYKIIDFNRLNGYDETKIGLWYIEYEDYEEEYKKLDKEIVKDESDKNDGYAVGGAPQGDPQEIISGDIIDDREENGGGDVHGEPQEAIEENVGNAETDTGYYFNATVIGINNRNIVVQALEDELINLSSDMFSFSIPETDSRVYLIGQKIKIEYTGTIRESYPAQIDVIRLEIIE